MKIILFFTIFFTHFYIYANTIVVYKYDKNIKNGYCDTSIDILDIQNTLITKGVKVLSAQKGHDGLIYSVKNQGCYNQSVINIFTIHKQDYDIVKNLGFDLCKNLLKKNGDCYPLYYSDYDIKNKNKFYVYIYKHSYSAQDLLNKNLKTMEQELIDAKIVVYKRYKAVDGLKYDFSTKYNTSINVYVIEKSELGKSIAMGYHECAWLDTKQGSCYVISKNK